MRNQIYYLSLLLLIFHFSCSSDPCADMTCGFGECIDGTCICNDGVLGDNCDFQFLGEFIADLLTREDCDDPSLNGDMAMANENDQWCSSTSCLKLRLTLNADNTFEIRRFTETYNGVFWINEQESIAGIYKVSGEQFELCPSDQNSCFIFRISEDREGLIWKDEDPDNDTGCSWIYTFTSLN